MQSETKISSESTVDDASLYHTKFLMAHNKLHAATHESNVDSEKLWRDYLAELETAEEVSRHPA